MKYRKLMPPNFSAGQFNYELSKMIWDYNKAIEMIDRIMFCIYAYTDNYGMEQNFKHKLKANLCYLNVNVNVIGLIEHIEDRFNVEHLPYSVTVGDLVGATMGALNKT